MGFSYAFGAGDALCELKNKNKSSCSQLCSTGCEGQRDKREPRPLAVQELHQRLVILVSADGGTADTGWEQPGSISALRAALPAGWGGFGGEAVGSKGAAPAACLASTPLSST